MLKKVGKVASDIEIERKDTEAVEKDLFILSDRLSSILISFSVGCQGTG